MQPLVVDLIYSTVVPLLVALSVGAFLYALAAPQITETQQLRRRMKEAVITSSAAAVQPRAKSLDDLIREADEAMMVRRAARPTLKQRLQQAELSQSVVRYWLVSAAIGVIVMAALSIASRLALPIVAFVAAGTGLFLPHLVVERRRNGRFQRFTQEFPNAVDVIVRGIRSGLPLSDCLKIIAAESQEPVRSEFKKVVEDQTLGMTNDEAVQRLAARVPLPEVRFFGIVIAIQSRTGGSLSEALENLSRVLRDRKKMREKIKAMSSEAKASASIIASLPFAVTFFLYLTSPGYISLLFTTTLGNLVLAGCAVWMSMGVLVMRKMISFQI